MTLHLNIVTPDRPIASAEVDEVTVPGIEGEFTVLPEHTTFLTLLGEGAVTYKKGSSINTTAIKGGFCEVRENRVSVLADEVR